MFLYIIGGFIGLFIIYIITRVLFYGIFKSFFDVKKYFEKEKKNEKEFKKKHGR